MKYPRQNYCQSNLVCSKCGFPLIHHAVSIAIQAEETCSCILCERFDWSRLQSIVGDDIVYYKDLNLKYRNQTWAAQSEIQSLTALTAQIAEMRKMLEAIECRGRGMQRDDRTVFQIAREALAKLTPASEGKEIV